MTLRRKRRALGLGIVVIVAPVTLSLIAFNNNTLPGTNSMERYIGRFKSEIARITSPTKPNQHVLYVHASDDEVMPLIVRFEQEHRKATGLSTSMTFEGFGTYTFSSLGDNLMSRTVHREARIA